MEFNEAYFNNGDTGYDDYKDYPHFLERAQWIRDFYNLNKFKKNILIAGCAYGFTVKHLQSFVGFDDNTFGVESSFYCQSIQDPTIVNLSDYDLNNSSWVIPNFFDMICSWNVLDCLASETDAETIVGLMNTSKALQIHIICCTEDIKNAQNYIGDGYFIKPLSYWQNLITVDGSIIVEYETRNVYVLDGSTWVLTTALNIPLSWGLMSN